MTMSRDPDYRNMSVALSEVLAEIGLNDVIVNKRRRSVLMIETTRSVFLKFLGDFDTKLYMFGSQSEGTTTIGLSSDFDNVISADSVIVIKEYRDLKPGVLNLLMVETEVTSPGYCMLQVMEPYAPIAEPDIFKEHCFRDRQDRRFLKNTCFQGTIFKGQEQHGPARSEQSKDRIPPYDIVYAFTCNSQLPVVREQRWLYRLNRPWPSEDLKRYIANCQCFLVPVGCKGSVNETLEWRISTSLAERYLMFSLNVTQLQVYVLMKMLLKTNININVPEESHISSFMCKTVVLHCVQNTDPNEWQSHMLIRCLQFSLFTLYVCVVNENCPHFIIRSNNLMARRLTQHAKNQLQENLRWIFGDIVSRGILSLHIDDVASRLMLKLNPVRSGIERYVIDKDYQDLCADLFIYCAYSIRESIHAICVQLFCHTNNEQIALLQQYVQRLEHVYTYGNTITRSTCGLLAPYFYTTLGSMLASESIQSSHTISHQALAAFSLGLNSDVASSRLKLASVFFCVGDMERAEAVLRDLLGRYDINICEPVCICTQAYTRKWLPMRYEAFLQLKDESDIPKMTSACVTFTQAEKSCVPKELQYEMYRSTREDSLLRNRWDYYWMNWAAVDSLPYLHFLCYKVYGHTQRRADQQRALHNLMLTIQIEPNLTHRETALNLLGQCYEQDKRWNDALKCYSWSLNIRRRNNVANVHICKLLCRLSREK